LWSILWDQDKFIKNKKIKTYKVSLPTNVMLKSEIKKIKLIKPIYSLTKKQKNTKDISQNNLILKNKLKKQNTKLILF